MKNLLTIFLILIFFSAGAQNLNTPNKSGPLGTQVNTISGNLFVPRTDIFIPGRGFNLHVRFYYNSYSYLENAGFGNGWSFNYDVKYKSDTTPGRKIITWGDGRADKYDSIGNGNYASPVGFYSKFVQYQPGKFVLTETDSTKYYFDNSTHRKVTKMVEPNGNFLNFNFTDTLLTSIVNAAGQTISLTYNTNGRLASVTDAVTTPARTFNYAYDGTGNLIQVTDPLGGKVQYTYLVNGPMKTLSDKNENKIDIIYYSDFSAKELIGCNKRISFSYDTTSKQNIIIDHVEDGENIITKYTYAKINGVTWVTSISGNCCGADLSIEYDNNGNKIKETDGNGNVYSSTYDANGNRLTVTDPLGVVSTYTYTAMGKIATFKDGKGATYTLTYDAGGNLTKMVTPGNLIYTATFNNYGDIITSTDPKGNTYSYNYDAFGNPISATGPNGYNATLSYDARGNLLSFRDGRGFSSTAEYDILDRLKKVTDPLNKNTQIVYDAQGNITSVINKNNETTSFNYDASNRPVKLTDPAGNVAEKKYNALNNVVAFKNALGSESFLTFDSRNRLSKITDAVGDEIKFDYDNNGNIVKASLANGQETTYTYDKLDRLIKKSDQNGDLSTFTYDAIGNTTSITNAAGNKMSFVYDELNRVKTITDAIGNSAHFTYDDNGNISSITDRNGFTSHFTYDSLNRQKTYTDNNGAIVSISYDTDGNVTQLTDQNANSTTYTYDNNGRKRRMTFADNTFQEFSYDNMGNMITKRLTDGSSVSFEYDELNRMVKKTLPGGEVHSFVYNAMGRITSATSPAGTVALTYDALGRITSETFEGRTVTYEYNTAGRSQKTIYPDNSVVIKEYDGRNRLIKILKDSVLLVEYGYNSANKLTSKTFSNGVNTSMQYDIAGRLNSITTADGAIQQTTFSYDKEGNKTVVNRMNIPSLKEEFGYDNSYRLTSHKRGAVTNTYGYDAVGNRMSANINGVNTTYTTNNLNQLTSQAGSQNINFIYDGRGNLRYDGKYYKSYDGEGRLKKDSASPSNVITYNYDAFNRRVIKSINGSILKYTYDGMSQIEERNGSNQLVNQSVFASFISPVLSERSGNKYYYHADDLNSVEAITNENGEIVERYQYDAYGNFVRRDASGNTLSSSIAGNRYAFTGQEYDSATASYKFFYRNYSAQTGTFNQRDLIEYGDGMGMYQYVGNNPANGIDVLGLLGGYDSPNPDLGPAPYVPWDPSQGPKTSMTEFLGKLIPKGLSISNFLLSFETVSDAVDKRLISVKEEIIECVGKTKQSLYGLRQLHKNKWVIAFFGKAKDTKEFLYEASKKLSSEMDDVAVTVKNFDLGKALGITELAYKGGVFLDEITDGISPAGKAEWDALGEFAMGGLGNAGPVGKVLGWLDFGTEASTGKSLFQNMSDMVYSEMMIYQTRKQYSEWRENAFEAANSCPLPPGGTLYPPPGTTTPPSATTTAVRPLDPNEIIGPTGQPSKKWVSVNDRMHYTILCENDKSASAPAKYIRISTPIEPKQDATTLELGSYGFNNQEFDIPQGLSSYYQRLDCRDSMNLFIDVVAGYDQMNNEIFWEFRSIDPITLQPTEEPLAGLLFLQDSTRPNYGHGYVTFSIKPKANAQTLDTIGARAEIVFDENEMIATNIYTNTIDAKPPVSQISAASFDNDGYIHLNWTGADDTNGCGIRHYTLYVSTDGINFSILAPTVYGTDTSFHLAAGPQYCFFVLATDSVGNMEVLTPGEYTCASYIVVPVTWMYFKGRTVDKDNLLEWSTASEQNSKEFIIERSLDGTTFIPIGTRPAAGNSSTPSVYNYTDRDIDKLNAPVMYYRIKQVDIENRFAYSDIVRLNYNGTPITKTLVYPNPTAGQITITTGDENLLGTVAVITDVNGRILKKEKITSRSQKIHLTGFMNGVYFIRLENKEVLKVIKQ